MAKKVKQNPAVPSEVNVPQVDRYPGSDVIGMEYTTARPMHFETGVDSPVYLPPSHWPSPYSFKSHTNTQKKG